MRALRRDLEVNVGHGQECSAGIVIFASGRTINLSVIVLQNSYYMFDVVTYKHVSRSIILYDIIFKILKCFFFFFCTNRNM